jgi:hypothetical protein
MHPFDGKLPLVQPMCHRFRFSRHIEFVSPSLLQHNHRCRILPQPPNCYPNNNEGILRAGSLFYLQRGFKGSVLASDLLSRPTSL